MYVHPNHLGEMGSIITVTKAEVVVRRLEKNHNILLLVVGNRYWTEWGDVIISEVGVLSVVMTLMTLINIRTLINTPNNPNNPTPSLLPTLPYIVGYPCKYIT